MNEFQIRLNEKNAERVNELVRATGKTPDQLVNEAFDQFAAEVEQEEHKKFLQWREALLKIEGMWKDRNDLPDFEELRRSWDRNVWSR